MSYTVLVCGSRNWQDNIVIQQVLETLPSDTHVVHGACLGADTIADHIAKSLGMKVTPYPADWQQYGNAAGPIRNRYMLKDSNPDLVIAFHHDMKHSKGTKDMVEVAVKANVTVDIVNRFGRHRHFTAQEQLL